MKGWKTEFCRMRRRRSTVKWWVQGLGVELELERERWGVVVMVCIILWADIEG
jgi:hypothetical protein